MESRTVDYRDVSDAEAQHANRADWDAEADDYQREHGKFLRDVGFIWCPEGLDEADAGLLGEVAGKRVLDVGAGAGQSARWLHTQGAEVVAFDLSFRQLQHSRRIDEETSIVVPSVCATATALPFADEAFDLACSAFGALPFIIDITAAFQEISRVVAPNGLVVFSVVHPIRRAFPDDPGLAGLTVTRSYFDRTPYVERSATGLTTYVEPHHTIEDWVRALRDADLTIEAIIEPPWPADHDRIWGGWGPVRGAVLPGTAIFVTRRAA